MAKRLKKILITGFFIFGILTGLQAQEKTDFMVVYLHTAKPVILVIQNDTPAKTIETNKKLSDASGQTERLLSVVSQYTSEGWEVINVSSSPGMSSTVFHLKRKSQL